MALFLVLWSGSLLWRSGLKFSINLITLLKLFGYLRINFPSFSNEGNCFPIIIL
jgi:hypothetical protein